LFVAGFDKLREIFNLPMKNKKSGNFDDIFPAAEFCYEYIPSFSSLWAFKVASSKYNPGQMSSSVVSTRLKERKLKNLSYYDPETHRRLFCLPKNIRTLLGRNIKSLCYNE
jgi:spermidine synthase